MTVKSLDYTLGFLVFLFLIPVNLPAQIAEGSIVGFTIDPSGAAIPGSSVEA